MWLRLAVGGFIVGCGRLSFDSNAAFSEAVLADSPTAYWRLEETTGSHLDEMGMHPSVAVRVSRQGVATETTAVGRGDEFDGIDDEITFADHGDFEVGASSFTVELVGEISIVGSSYNRFISHEVYGEDGWYVSMDQGPAWGVAFSRWAGGTERFAASLSYVPVGQLVHVVGVYDADTAALLLYMDGVQRGASTGVTGTVNDITQDLVLGRPSNSASQHFVGRIFEVAYYKGRALSMDRVTTHYEALDL